MGFELWVMGCDSMVIGNEFTQYSVPNTQYSELITQNKKAPCFHEALSISEKELLPFVLLHFGLKARKDFVVVTQRRRLRVVAA